MPYSITRAARYGLGAALLSLGMAQPALAQGALTEQQLRVQSLAATCAACHGTGGNAVEGYAVGGLSQFTPEYIITNMKAYKSGERPAKVMHQLAKGYTDEQIELIANYLGKKD